ncbi:MAG: hypothetical protein FWF59_04810 [Turicibacter sp.]|nr:hypothetical protein [Turicibacter sp.]
MKKLMMMATAAVVLAGCANDGYENEAVREIAPAEEVGQEVLGNMEVARDFDIDWNSVTRIQDGGYPATGFLSLDEAARMGGEYLQELMEIDISGMTVAMNFFYGDRPVWDAWVLEDGADLDTIWSSASYTFRLDAATGERIDAGNFALTMNHPNAFLFDRLDGFDESEIQVTYPQPTTAEVAFYQTLAQHFAQIHFGEEAVLTPLTFEDSRFWQSSEGSDSELYDFNHLFGMLTFRFSDETGRVAYLHVQMQTGDLSQMTTSQSDIDWDSLN